MNKDKASNWISLIRYNLRQYREELLTAFNCPDISITAISQGLSVLSYQRRIVLKDGDLAIQKLLLQAEQRLLDLELPTPPHLVVIHFSESREGETIETRIEICDRIFTEEVA